MPKPEDPPQTCATCANSHLSGDERECRFDPPVVMPAFPRNPVWPIVGDNGHCMKWRKKK